RREGVDFDARASSRAAGAEPESDALSRLGFRPPMSPPPGRPREDRKHRGLRGGYRGAGIRRLWDYPMTSAAAVRAGLPLASRVGESSASRARLMVIWRVAEVIFAPNRS